jgi:CheY-like chemotaxis protein
MKVLVIDDDRVYTEPVVWRLEHEGFEVVHCISASEVLSGWFEVTDQTVESLRRDGVPASVLERLVHAPTEDDGGLGEPVRCVHVDAFRCKLERRLGEEEASRYFESIRSRAHRDPLTPAPDVVILDLMMPREHYGKQESENGRATGVALMRDIVERVPSARFVVLTVRDEPECHAALRKRFGRSIVEIVQKPALPSRVAEAVKNVFAV